jgi:predicted transcriptional regulator
MINRSDIMTENIRHMTAYFRQKEQIMIEAILGSKNAERVLVYIFARNEGYAREIASFYNADLKSIQMQLDKFEKSGVLASRTVGRTRPYVFNPRYPFLNELKALLGKAFSFYPDQEQEALVMNRRRPRARGKVL